MSERLRALLKRVSRFHLMVVAPLLVGLCVVGWAWQWQSAQAAAVTREQRRAARCAELANSILTLRQKPQVYEERIVDAHRLAGAVEQAAQRAGVEQAQIMAIRPEHPRRITDTPYVESFTRVRLARVSMRQLAELIWHLDQGMRGLSIPELRVWAETGEGDRWEAEVGLAGLAYMPAEQPR